MKKLINIGFEFTASPKVGKTPPKRVYLDSQMLDSSAVNGYWNKEASTITWIKNRYNSDDCGCEVSTPIIKS